jgi:glycosyltransferase involved in cell wall biosynthesis
MIYLALPIGSWYGWAICGKNLGRELSQLVSTRYLRVGNYDMAASPFERLAYGELSIGTPEPGSYVIQGTGDSIVPWGRPLEGCRKIGLSFAVGTLTEEDRRWRAYWEGLISGSRWCQQLLAEQGLQSTVIYQGIDPLLFNEAYAAKQLFKDRFVIFSGGKFEYRKGQDLVIKAYKIFQDTHKDALLIAAWFNGWPSNMNSMARSRNILFTPGTAYEAIVQQTLSDNGVDLERVLVLGLMDNSAISQVYQNSDVGLFPNRAEAGTNLVLMEYMACGKPAIVSDCTGHKDVANLENAMLLQTSQVSHNGATWGESSVDKLVDRLEWVYDNQDQARAIGQKGAATIRVMTWRRMAEEILRLVKEPA